MHRATFVILFLVGCATAPTPTPVAPHPPASNRACLLIAEYQSQFKIDGTCEPAPSLPGESSDWAIWRVDGGVKWCHTTPDIDRPLPCAIIKPTTDEKAQAIANQAVANERAKVDDAAKAKKLEADAAAAKSKADAPAVKPELAKPPTKPEAKKP